jgi:hypothetical protein
VHHSRWLLRWASDRGIVHFGAARRRKTMSRQSDYRKRHPERVKESQRRWREQNQEYLREYNREYKRRNQKEYRERRKVELWETIVGIWGGDTSN